MTYGLEVLGPIQLWIPKTRLVGAGLIAVITIGAAFSTLTVGAFGFLVVALVFALIAGVVAWVNRGSCRSHGSRRSARSNQDGEIPRWIHHDARYYRHYRA